MKNNAKRMMAAALMLICASSWAAENRKPELFGSCLPWDGVSLELKVPLADGTFARARMWGKGMQAAQRGGLAALASTPMSQNQTTVGPGVLEVCKGSWDKYGDGCVGVQGSVKFDGPSALGEGSAVSGRLSIDTLGKLERFSVAMGKSSTCGRSPR